MGLSLVSLMYLLLPKFTSPHSSEDVTEQGDYNVLIRQHSFGKK